MKSAFEQCVERKATRFIVSDDGAVYLELRTNPQMPGAEVPLEKIEADASPYLSTAAGLAHMGIVKANDLVPIQLRADWRLSVQREKSYSVWTVYSQKLPAMGDFAQLAN
ncbi:hypothetical protein [Ectopseudomonas mendocina]|uniref:Uncharacterized protein n=1 Tax=Ectopseudomonas mendocina S5.2 TaxID=1225174 RepID=A0ABM5W3G0_ECTME|nr:MULTISPECIES: hypothetical protein [Pseudomonas aeruginosa group]ALN21793.1 hypothetical protein DW68_024250 [Pseudomonas mendocina S5.2]KER98150.1 hypothetical protein HN51_25475 [Pseudomonas mendocina]CRN67077.1 hypothetical protein PAERUG_P40_Scotland_4_VIM_2_09_12_04111 [Pseudomonas aeruginosa]